MGCKESLIALFQFCSLALLKRKAITSCVYVRHSVSFRLLTLKQTVIFDCCHSGSGTRKDSTDPTHLIRGFEITEPVPAKLDENIWSNPGQRGSTIPSGFLQTGLRSHVLLAACGAEETAKEQKGRGAFTKALLDALNAVSVDTISYADLLQRMHAIPE